jgi:antibiotic biosynthesis monooxygenase (ABM) superfamily enzyme
MSSPREPRTQFRAHRWFAAVLVTVAAWLVAFLVVTALLSLFGDELGSLPLALRALVISGVLVVLMINVVMPALNAAVARWVAGPARSRLPRGSQGSNRETSRA